jgi:hypothetical protein
MRYKGLEGLLCWFKGLAYLSDVTATVEQRWSNGRGTGVLIHAMS